jgi:Mlc titration factor MtfA (ptsG expression regulator)
MPFGYFILLFFLGYVIFIAIRSVELGRGIAAFFLGKPPPVYFELNQWHLPINDEQFIYRNEKFYRELSPKRQKSFGSRIMKFLDEKDFEGREGLRITREIKLVIAMAATKVSFGLRDFRYQNFTKIIVYPDEFFSKVSRLHLKGETNAAGIIVFSWKDLQYGNDYPNDSINLGYHEFAHALFIENVLNPNENNFKKHYREWLVFISRNAKLQEVKQSKVFREYASRNEVEFFAVAMENFFERPQYFRDKLPTLYEYMTKILNQYPLQK